MNSHNDMKLIMENWRRFSESEGFSEHASKVLIETKSYNSSLNSLFLEHKNKKISTKKYIDILQESIDKDLKELSKLEKQVLNEATGDTIKKVGQNIKGAVTGAFATVINKVNDLIMKVSLMIWNAPRQAALNLTKTLTSIKSFKNANPKVWAFLVLSLKILAMAAVAYAFLNPGTAEASVPVDQYGAAAVDFGRTKMIDASTPEGIQLLGALDVLTPDQLADTPLKNIEVGQLKQATALIKKAVMSKKPEEITGALKTILNAANSLSQQASNTADGGEATGLLQKFGQKVLQVAGTAVEKSNEIVAAKAGAATDIASGALEISGDTAAKKLDSLTRPENIQKIIKMFGKEGSGSMDAPNLMKKALQYGSENNLFSQEDLKQIKGQTFTFAVQKFRNGLATIGK